MLCVLFFAVFFLFSSLNIYTQNFDKLIKRSKSRQVSKCDPVIHADRILLRRHYNEPVTYLGREKRHVEWEQRGRLGCIVGLVSFYVRLPVFSLSPRDNYITFLEEDRGDTYKQSLWYPHLWYNIETHVAQREKSSHQFYSPTEEVHFLLSISLPSPPAGSLQDLSLPGPWVTSESPIQ